MLGCNLYEHQHDHTMSTKQVDQQTPLFGTEAIDQIKTMLDRGKQTVLVLTDLHRPPAHVRPLAVNRVDEEGALWFLSARDAEGHQHAMTQGVAQIIMSDPAHYHFLTLSGRIDEVESAELRERLWTPIAKAWFKEGPHDPRMGILRFRPDSGHYWDTKHGKMISMIKFAANALLGIGDDDGGKQGALRI